MKQHFISTNQSKCLNSFAEVTDALSLSIVRKHHCTVHRFYFPQRWGEEGEPLWQRHLGPQSVSSPGSTGLFGSKALGRRCLAKSLGCARKSWHLVSWGKRKLPFPFINPFPRWGASTCKTCLLNWSKKSLSKPNVLLPSSAQAGQAPSVILLQQQTISPSESSGGLSQCPPLCVL